MSHQPTSWDTTKYIASPAEDSGPSLSVKPDGPTTVPCGQALAPVPPSPLPVKEMGLMILDISGLSSSGSSASATLSSSLANRLMARLATAGSTLFQEKWKEKTTPLGRSYWAHTASARRTGDRGYISVPTPNTPSGGPNSKSTATHTGRMDLDGVATLASVCSPTAMDANRGGLPARPWDTGVPLTQQVALATVPTPCAQEDNKSVVAHLAMKQRMDKRDGTFSNRTSITSLQVISKLATVATPRSEDSQCAGAHRGIPDTLHSQANLAAAATPSTRDWKDSSGMSETGVDPDGSIRSRLDQLPRQAQLADSGATATGGTGETANIGQLDPAYSRWLMAVPPEWDGFACTAMRSVSKRPKRSSKPT